MTDYQGIIERVRAATGADRELDGDLFFELDPDFPNFALHMSSAPDPATFATGAYTSVKAPAYTGSTDAALALAEKVLPGMCPGIGQNVHHKYWSAWLSTTNSAGTVPVEIGSATHQSSAPLAIILATLLALQSQEPK